MTKYVVEVNETAVAATTQGTAWWQLFRKRGPSERFADLPPHTPMGSRVQVACDDDSGEHAEWLARHLIEQGLPKSAVKVKRLGDAR